MIGDKQTEKVEYLYVDFNPIIYLALGHLQSTQSLSGMNSSQIEAKLISTIIDSIKHIVNVLVKPTKLVYIAIDGPAPKCKLVTQRARRYKGIYEEYVKSEIRSKYDNATELPNWEKASITPGTAFMESLDFSLRSMIDQGIFCCPNVIFSDSSIASEGEHKITQHVKTLNTQPEDTIVIYSNDGDMAFLALQFPEKRMLTMIDIGFLPKNIRRECTHEYIYFDNNKFHEVFVDDLFYEPSEDDTVVTALAQCDNSNQQKNTNDTAENTTGGPIDQPIDKPVGDIIDQPAQKKQKIDTTCEANVSTDRLLLDFLFISFFGGNDFVRPIPFGKIKSAGSYQMYLKVYKKARERHQNEYLVESDGTINKRFLSDVLYLLSRQEPKKMSYYQQDIIKIVNEDPEWGPFESWTEEWLEYQHKPYYSPGHPEHNLVKEKLLSFSYHDPKQHNKWKGEYYKVNFGLNPHGDQKVYNIERSKICRDYLKCMIFTLKYYLNGKPPSWRWAYNYHVAPWPSDLFIALKNTDLNRLSQFYENRPYKPLEQLLLTVPVSSKVFPIEYRILKGWLPETNVIKLDRVNGEKYIYAEPKLRNVNEKGLLEEAKKIPLTKANAKRNRLGKSVYTYNKRC